MKNRGAFSFLSAMMVALFVGGCALNNSKPMDTHASVAAAEARTPFPPCNVTLFGFGESAQNLRQKINEIMAREGNAHDSITTLMGTDVRCAEFPAKDESFIRVYSDDTEGGKRFAQLLSTELKVAVEFITLDAVYVPSK